MRLTLLWMLCVPTILFAQKSPSPYIQILESAIACEDLSQFLPRKVDESICLSSIHIHNLVPVRETDMLMGGLIALRDEPWDRESLDHCALGLDAIQIRKRKAKLKMVSGTGKALLFKLEKVANIWYLRKLMVKQRHPEIPDKTQIEVRYYRSGP
ncbi:MAG: hypothetical protein AAF135_17920 [Bacteroidota bacterium]